MRHMLDREVRASSALQRVLRLTADFRLANCARRAGGLALVSYVGLTYSSFLLRLLQSTAVWTLGETQDKTCHGCAARAGDLVSNITHTWV